MSSGSLTQRYFILVVILLLVQIARFPKRMVAFGLVFLRLVCCGNLPDRGIVKSVGKLTVSKQEAQRSQAAYYVTSFVRQCG